MRLEGSFVGAGTALQGGEGWQLPPPRISFRIEAIPGQELHLDPRGPVRTLPPILPARLGWA